MAEEDEYEVERGGRVGSLSVSRSKLHDAKLTLSACHP